MADKKKSLLIVEDVEGLRIALGLLFEDEGYDVIQVANGREALKEIAKTHIDLIITDVLNR